MLTSGFGSEMLSKKVTEVQVSSVKSQVSPKSFFFGQVTGLEKKKKVGTGYVTG